MHEQIVIVRHDPSVTGKVRSAFVGCVERKDALSKSDKFSRKREPARDDLDEEIDDSIGEFAGRYT